MKNKKRLVISFCFLVFVLGVSLPLFITNHKKLKADTVTDLTGSTWLLNTTIDRDDVSLFKNINFTSNGNNYTTIQIICFYDSDDGWYGPSIDYNTTNVYYAGSWSSNDYKTINITGGTDATNSDLISWLQTNATLQSITPSGTEITQKYWSPMGVIRMQNNEIYFDDDITYTILYNEQRSQYDDTVGTGLYFKGINTSDDTQYSYIYKLHGTGIDILYLGTSNDIDNSMWLEFTLGDYIDTDLYDFMSLWGVWFDDADAYLVGMNQGYAEGTQHGIALGQADGVEYTNLISGIFNGVGDILSIQVFPNITIALIIGLPLLLAVLVIIIKLLRG